MTELEKRIIDISYKYNLSHISSCLNCVGMLDKIFEIRKDEPVILSNGHAGLALYVVLEKYGLGNAEELFKKHGTHPNRDIEHGIFASSGSLGHGIGIAVGMAFLNRNRNVFVMTSDGECTEGSVWEALRIARDNMLMNLRIIVIANGFGANGKIDTDDLRYRLNTFYPSPACQVIEKHLFSFPEYLQGLEGHYVKLDKEKYECIQKY